MRKSKVEKALIVIDALISETESLFYPYKSFGKQFRKQRGILSRTLSYLKEKGYLDEVEEKAFKLANKGLIKIFRFNNKNQRWDGNWHILTFDIAEKDRFKRDFFRYKLKELDFRYIQKSVWICPWDISEKLEILIEELNLKDNIFYFVSKVVLNEKSLKGKWNLE